MPVICTRSLGRSFLLQTLYASHVKVNRYITHIPVLYSTAIYRIVYKGTYIKKIFVFLKNVILSNLLSTGLDSYVPVSAAAPDI